MRCDGGEGTNGGGSGGDGAGLPTGQIRAENLLHHQAFEDELLQAVA